MNTALVICGGIALSATVYQVMRARLRAAQADIIDLKADSDQLAQALKETQEDLKISDKAYELLQVYCDKLTEQIKLTKVTRDPKTGRMVSAEK